jgi:hypothetical protein
MGRAVSNLRYLVLLVALGSLFWAGMDMSVQAQEAPLLVVEGEIANATPGGDGVSGIAVTFHMQSASVHDHSESLTDDAGRFRFDGITFDPTLVYGMSVKYQGALYGMDIDLSQGSPAPIAVDVYDATDSQDGLFFASESVLFASADESSRTVSTLEIIMLVNDSQLTYVPGSGPMELLRFGLPEDASDLRLETTLVGADFIQVDLGFALLASVPPGEHELMYSYVFPYDGAEASFIRTLRNEVKQLRVLAPIEVLKLSSDRFGDPETVAIGDRPYQLLEADGLEVGDVVSFTLGGLPQPTLRDDISGLFDGVRFEYAAPVSLGLVMVSILAYALWRRFLPGGGGYSIGSEVPVQGGEGRALRQMISDLEKSFEAGDVTEGEYRRRHALLTSRLASLAEG